MNIGFTFNVHTYHQPVQGAVQTTHILCMIQPREDNEDNFSYAKT